MSTDAVLIVKARVYKQHKDKLLEVVKQAHHSLCYGKPEEAQATLFRALEEFGGEEDDFSEGTLTGQES
jgi:hypothetical protein